MEVMKVESFQKPRSMQEKNKDIVRRIVTVVICVVRQ